MEPAVSSLSAEVNCLNFYDFHCFSALVCFCLRAWENNSFQMALEEVCDRHKKVVVYQDRCCTG